MHPASVEACRRALGESELCVTKREQAMAAAVELYSWDRTTAEMKSALEMPALPNTPFHRDCFARSPSDLRIDRESAINARVRAS